MKKHTTERYSKAMAQVDAELVVRDTPTTLTRMIAGRTQTVQGRELKVYVANVQLMDVLGRLANEAEPLGQGFWKFVFFNTESN